MSFFNAFSHLTDIYPNLYYFPDFGYFHEEILPKHKPEIFPAYVNGMYPLYVQGCPCVQIIAGPELSVILACLAFPASFENLSARRFVYTPVNNKPAVP
jgi:hypothetical protein